MSRKGGAAGGTTSGRDLTKRLKTAKKRTQPRLSGTQPHLADRHPELVSGSIYRFARTRRFERLLRHRILPTPVRKRPAWPASSRRTARWMLNRVQHDEYGNG